MSFIVNSSYHPQVKLFRELKTCTCTEECNNYRPLQNVNTRVVKINRS